MRGEFRGGTLCGAPKPEEETDAFLDLYSGKALMLIGSEFIRFPGGNLKEE